MINKALLKQSIRSNYKILLIFMAVLAMYTTIIIGMYTPEVDETMKNLMGSMSPELLAAFGFAVQDNSLTSFLAGYLYGFLAIVFPMIYEIIVANRLIAKHVDRGSMAFLLSTPNKRSKIAFTQMVYMILSLVILIGFFAGLGVLVSEIKFPGELDIKHYLLMNLGVFLLHVMISGIGFLASCVSDETKMSLAIGAGFPIAFFLVQMLANVGGKLEDLKYATILTLFDTKELLAGSSQGIIMIAVLGVAGLILYIAGIIVFQKRDLPI